MASSISTYLAAKLTDVTLRGVAFTAPTSVHVALFTAEPGPGAGGPEANYAGYARRAVTFGAANAAGTALNTNKIEFPPNTGSSSQTVTHIAIMDAATGGNKLYIGDLTQAKTLDNGDYAAFAVGALSNTLEVRP